MTETVEHIWRVGQPSEQCEACRHLIGGQPIGNGLIIAYACLMDMAIDLHEHEAGVRGFPLHPCREYELKDPTL